MGLKFTKKTHSQTSSEYACATPAAQVLASDGFPIVAWGASAGGLHAFEQFFRAMPATSGMGFVLLSHLDPDHASMLTEILQRSTAMQVLPLKSGMRVEPNRVHVMPPNCAVTIMGGVLKLSLPEAPRGRRLPIDLFMSSLAADQGTHAVGIVLSGNGIDGTRGLGAILGAGGVTLVQDPDTAEYDGMPRSAIEAGLATRELAPASMPDALLHLAALRAGSAQSETVEQSVAIARIIASLHTETGHDFTHYKGSTIARRIERRMMRLKIEDFTRYVQYLAEHPAEAKDLFKELLINVTHFFRDPEAFAHLSNEVLPALLARVTDGAWYLARVQPYRTTENRIDGVVLTFTDISGRMEAELAVQRARELAEGIVDTVRELLVVLDQDLKVMSASRSFYQRFKANPAEVVGTPIFKLGNGPWNSPKLRELLDDILPRNHALEGYALEHADQVQDTTLILNARRIVGTKDSKPLILLAIEQAVRTGA